MSEPLGARLLPKHFSLVREIAEKGQLSLAASALALTQPAASRMLAEIERLVGVPVFHRTPKGMEPTEVGHAIARRAQTLLEEIREAAREIEAIRRGHAGTVRVGAVTGGAVGYVVPAMQALKEEAEAVDIHVDVAPSDQLVNGLIAGHHDFILGRLPSGFDVRHFDVIGLRIEEVKLLVHHTHPFADTADLSVFDLVHFPWVMQAPGAPVRRAVENVFIANGAPIPPNIINTTSLLVMIALLSSSNAIAPMSREVSDLLCHDARIAGLKTLDMRQLIEVEPYHLITLKGKRMSTIALRLKDFVLTEFRERGRM
ncbi:LysR family transcriptional regulator [Ciceribacter sp. L1K23]|uniref:LysR family transcriptional regulator n=1 Tax=Ciceribacter sp. L1K23 TaxID=2820276 RepID=UPI001B810CBD|nr:LysR family transcriptional regulator [Ciceribacter sp. L1K23]MBR0554080.1 LysR family transcriptional regulator [Ciceribacter sp. L1K23]